MCYNKQLFSIYKKESLPLLYTADHIWLNALKKNIISFDVLVEGKSEVVNWCSFFHTLELKYNLFLIGTIKKAGYLILTKKGKISVLDNKNNVAVEATKIEISYLVNVLAREKTLALAFLYSVPHNFCHRHRGISVFNI